MKNEIKQLIDRLADKTLSFGCRVEYEDSRTLGDRGGAIYIDSFPREAGFDTYPAAWIYGDGGLKFLKGLNKEDSHNLKRIGHPILLGDIVDHVCIEDGGGGALALLTIYWKKCGARYSLQQIFDRAEWEWSGCRVNCPEPWCPDCESVPKHKEIRSLFEHLLTLKI